MTDKRIEKLIKINRVNDRLRRLEAKKMSKGDFEEGKKKVNVLMDLLESIDNPDILYDAICNLPEYTKNCILATYIIRNKFKK